MSTVPGVAGPWCLAVVPLPPPTHGAALVSSFMVRELTTRSARAGVRVVVCDTAPDTGVGWRYHLGRLQLNVAAVVMLLGKVARDRSRPVSVYIGGAGGLGLVYQLVLVATCRILRIPTYFHHHSFAYIHQRSLVMGLIVRCGGRGLRHVYLGDTMHSRFADRYRPRGRGYRCSNVVAVDGATAARPTERTSAESTVVESGSGPVLGHLSNLSRAKGLYEVMDTFDSVRAVVPGARLRLAGGASDPKEKADLMTFSQRHDGAVDWIGPVPNTDVTAFMSGIDLLLFPSRYANEAQPLVVLEAMQVGTPVAAYDIGELASCIGSGGAVCEETATFPDFVTKLVQGDGQGDDNLRQLGHRAARQFEESLRTAEADLTHLTDDLLSERGVVT